MPAVHRVCLALVAFSVAASAGVFCVAAGPGPRGWHPPKEALRAPAAGVTLDGGPWRAAFDRNVAYLVGSFTVEQMLFPFRQRAGANPDPPSFPEGFWSSLPGSDAGRFLMGAGHTLRWQEAPELRRRLDALVEGIAAAREADGYLMAYPRDRLTYSEYGNYVRSWVTQGLLAAGAAGNGRALELAREWQDWFNRCEDLPRVRNLKLGYQGMVANTSVYFSPVGRPADLEVVQRYYEEEWWIRQLAARDPRAIWARPKSTPHTHCYEVTALEAYLDLYRATGERRYLDAVLGGWTLFRDNWLHVGGSFAISEGPSYPPRSYFLEGTGELCCSAFWIRLNQRLHHLFPGDERYVAEMERSIWNVGLANQGETCIRYNAQLHGRKEPAQCLNTCCEGQGTRLYASLPEYLYSLSNGGATIDMYAPSSITWRRGGLAARLITDTSFPYEGRVQVRVETERPTRFDIDLRIPGWAARPVPVLVNGQVRATGRPGTYVTVGREWVTGDTIELELPMSVRVTHYDGYSQIFNTDRYGFEYGPLLLAFVGPLDFMRSVGVRQRAEDWPVWLVPDPDQPLHFRVKGQGQYEIFPYWLVGDQSFTCFPIVGPSR